jgi:hypothetical protein
MAMTLSIPKKTTIIKEVLEREDNFIVPFYHSRFTKA